MNMTTRRGRAMMLGTLMMSALSLVVHAQESARSVDDIWHEYVGGVMIDGQDTTMIDFLVNVQEPYKVRKGLIIHFCDTFLGEVGGRSLTRSYIDYDSYRYDPRQSLFMYTLCVHTDQSSEGVDINGQSYEARNYQELFTDISYNEGGYSLVDYLKEDADLGEIRGLANASNSLSLQTCDPSGSMQSCEFSAFLPIIFTTILNDLSNLKLATLYGYKYGNTREKREQAISDFSDSYFGVYDSEEFPCNEPGIYYLYDATYESNKKHCAHPMTYRMLDETIQSAYRLTQNTKLLNAEPILEEECGAMTDNLYACAFSNTGLALSQTDWGVFRNIYLNELLYFKLFATYYSNKILTDPLYRENIVGGNIGATFERSQREAINLYYETQIAQQAIFQTMRLLADLYTSYPVHVGLMAYLEDLLRLRDTVVKPYNPLHQLYYTWRNPQACEE